MRKREREKGGVNSVGSGWFHVWGRTDILVGKIKLKNTFFEWQVFSTAPLDYFCA